MAEEAANANANANDFPKVQGGGSLILAWQIKGKKVVVVGGGEVSLHLPTFLSSLSFFPADS